MRVTLSRLSALGFALLVGASGHAAHAAPCGRPDVDLTFPADGAALVPNNAILTAHYSAPALYADEVGTLTDETGGQVLARTTFEDAENVLRIAPEAPLADGTYNLEWPSLRGVTGGLGLGKRLKFSVAGTADQAPPRFAGLVSADWDLSRDRDPCTDRLEDRFVFKLQAGDATDDSGVSMLALDLFETRNPMEPELSAPAKVGLRAWPVSGEVELRRPASKAGKTCFAAVAQDLLGNVSGGGEREVCVNTQKPPFFEGCSVSRGPAPAPGGALWLLLAALGFYYRRGPGDEKSTQGAR